jgi:DNA-binding response OmpR family regulator
MLRRLFARLAGGGTTAPPGLPVESAASILLVDDDASLRDLVKLWLEGSGYSVTTASNGREGVATARRDRPDLIVLDGNMPEMDGFEALKHLRRDRRTARIPVVMLTMRIREGDVLTGFRSGAQEYLTKPISMEELLGSVKEQLRRAH